jgi:hypothetical protein
MYSSEYLRNKKRAAAQIQSPTRVRDAGLWTQIRRYQSSVPQNLLPISAGQSKELSGEGLINAKAGAAVCCGPPQVTVTKPATCCDLVAPQLFPTNFYSGAKQDCCPVNGPPLGGQEPCCPDLPANTALVTWTKKPRTRG